MINTKKFYNFLKRNGIEFFTGIPDSLLKDFCDCIIDNSKAKNHVIAANEGGAVALAAGYYLASGKIGLVYMQNSGQGNAVNPLTSLADQEVYSIPMILLIGWRGEPGTKDEPQHIKQGKITLELLKTLGISFEILPKNLAAAKKAIKKAVIYMKSSNAPYALVVQQGIFEAYKPKNKIKNNIFSSKSILSRERAIEIIADHLNGNEVVVSTTGKASRELFEIRQDANQGHERDFLTVGSMGHSAQIALGIALSQPERQVYCLDGDGSLIMHMGSLAVIGNVAPKNFKHIVLNNYAYESVGGQPTVAASINIPAIAENCGFKNIFSVSGAGELASVLADFEKAKGPALLEIKVVKNSRPDLGRPDLSPVENKNIFMNFLNNPSYASIGRLKNFFDKNQIRRIFLVTGKKSYVSSGAEKLFRRLLRSYGVTRFNDFSPNPRMEDIEKGIKIFRNGNYDAVLAIGGGSVIDAAKLINIFSTNNGMPADYIEGKKIIKNQGKPLVVVPTTAGSGSEATHFAVVYVKGKKHSIAHQYILPTYSIIEPALTMNMPARLAAASGMDALSQAIESYWCVKGTDNSKRLAARAIRLILDNMVQSVKKPTYEARAAMTLAAHLAGQAINITKTTAPHAISYFFTSRFGISHGHAVALTLGDMILYNSKGEKYLKKTIAEICRMLGVKNAVAAKYKIINLMQKIGLKTKFHQLGILKKDIDLAVESVDAERLANNPRKIGKNDIRKVLNSIL